MPSGVKVSKCETLMQVVCQNYSVFCRMGGWKWNYNITSCSECSCMQEHFDTQISSLKACSAITNTSLLTWPESNMPSWQMQGKDYMHNYMWWKLTPDFIQGSVGADNPIKLDLPDRITTPATFKTATLLRCGPVDVAIRQFRQPQQKPPGGNSGCGPNFQTSAGFH